MTESKQHNTESNNNKAGDAQERQITVHADSMIVVQEVRKAVLKKGCNVVQAEGVPNNVDISSIMFGMRAEKPCRIVSKAFRAAETMTGQRALNELKGQEVFLHYTTPFKLQTYNGILLNADRDEVVLARPNNETMIAQRPEAISSKMKLKDLREMPALEFEIESSEDQNIEFAVLYRSRSAFSCPISHSLVFDERESVMRKFESGALLSNRSGCDWSNVSIKIMAGEPQQQQKRAQPQALRMASFSADYSDELAGGSPSSAESVGERKLFALPPGINLKNGDTKQISLIEAAEIPVIQRYELTEGQYVDQPVQRKLKLKNLSCDKSSGFGIPIPAGTVSIYEKDSSNSLQLTNQTQIPDVSIGESVNLEQSTNDIKATRKMVKQEEAFADKNRKPLTKKALEDLERAKASKINRKYIKQPVLVKQFFEVSVKNFKDRTVEVGVPQSLSENQRILQTSAKFVAGKEGSKATLNVPARAEKGAGEVTMTYVIESFVEYSVEVGE